MERNTDLSVPTFLWNKGKQVLQRWHGPPATATASDTNAALRLEIAMPVPGLSATPQCVCSVPFHVSQL